MVEDPLAASLQAQLEHHINDQDIPGAAVVVTVLGKGRFPLAAGFEDLPRTRKMKPADYRVNTYSAAPYTRR